MLEGENAVLLNRELMGATNPAEAAPGTIRSDFAQSIDANAVHGRFHDFCGAGSQLFLYERRNLPAQLSVRETGGSQGAIMKPNLLGLSREKIKALFSELEEKPFRTQQVMQWIHQRGVLDLNEMTDISKVLRGKLEQLVEVRAPKIVADYPSEDGSHKWIIEVASGSRVEMVFILEGSRGTLCVSSQAGCSLDCSFCATGKQGFNSNLTVAEIIGQVWLARQQLDGSMPRRSVGSPTLS